MEITTKYNIGDKVWRVWGRIEREVEKCSICAGAGKVAVVGVGDLVQCPKCWGKGEMETVSQFVRALVSSQPMTVGQVRVKIEGPTGGDGRHASEEDRSNMGPRSHKREEEYMMVETGVGSGTIYPVEDLFPSRAEAEAEARARTAESVDGIQRYEEVEALAG